MVNAYSKGKSKRTIMTIAKRIMTSILKNRIKFFCAMNNSNNRIKAVLMTKVINIDETENNMSLLL